MIKGYLQGDIAISIIFGFIGLFCIIGLLIERYKKWNSTRKH